MLKKSSSFYIYPRRLAQPFRFTNPQTRWLTGLSGEKFLQRYFFPEHNQIEFLGKSEPNHSFSSPSVAAFVSDTLRKGVFKCDIDLNQSRFNRDVKPLLRQGRAVLMSFEDGSHGSPRRRLAKMTNLKAVCGDCRLLITLRSPIDFVESMYLQRLKKNNTDPKQWLSRPWTSTIEEWVDSCWEKGEKAELSHLYYSDFIADWESTFGKESVCIMLYEHLRESPEKFFDQICSYLGVQPVCTETILNAGTVNPRLTVSQVEMIHKLNDSPIRSMLFRFAKSKLRKSMVGNYVGQGAHASLSHQWVERIRLLTKPGNQALTAHRNLPLEKYGYPL